MNTNKKRNRIILCLCSIMVLFASVFAFIPLNKESKIVKADTISSTATFTGSSVTFTSTMYEYFYSSDGSLGLKNLGGLNSYELSINSNYSNYFPFLYTIFNVQMRYNQDTGILEFKPRFRYPVIVDGNFLVSDTGKMVLSDYTYLNFLTDNYNDGYTYKFNDTWISTDGSTGLRPNGGYCFVSMDNSSYNGGTLSIGGGYVAGIIFKYYVEGNFLIDKMVSVTYQLDHITYTDSYGNYIRFQITSSNFAPDTRTYYFGNVNLTDNEYYQSGYQSGYNGGYNQGYREGEIEGQDSGYTSGYNAGKNDGYNLGYNTGLENSNEYSFTSLISSVIDVPVKTFTSLFNFEILGVNLSGFFLGLLTCCIVLTIVKLLL